MHAHAASQQLQQPTVLRDSGVGCDSADNAARSGDEAAPASPQEGKENSGDAAAKAGAVHDSSEAQQQAGGWRTKKRPRQPSQDTAPADACLQGAVMVATMTAPPHASPFAGQQTGGAGKTGGPAAGEQLPWLRTNRSKTWVQEAVSPRKSGAAMEVDAAPAVQQPVLAAAGSVGAEHPGAAQHGDAAAGNGDAEATAHVDTLVTPDEVIAGGGADSREGGFDEAAAAPAETSPATDDDAVASSVPDSVEKEDAAAVPMGQDPPAAGPVSAGAEPTTEQAGAAEPGAAAGEGEGRQEEAVRAEAAAAAVCTAHSDLRPAMGLTVGEADAAPVAATGASALEQATGAVPDQALAARPEQASAPAACAAPQATAQQTGSAQRPACHQQEPQGGAEAGKEGSGSADGFGCHAGRRLRDKGCSQQKC